jgi:hypothetical protein
MKSLNLLKIPQDLKLIKTLNVSDPKFMFLKTFTFTSTWDLKVMAMNEWENKKENTMTLLV